jgi:hypothetical protein
LKDSEGVQFPANLSNENLVTIVLERNFRNLIVSRYGFHVTLDFNGVKHTIYITFVSIILITDPTRNFFLDLRSMGAYEMIQVEPKPKTTTEDDDLIYVDLGYDDNYIN